MAGDPTHFGKMDQQAPIESPCVLLCVLDPRSGFCFGCGRTRDEIGSWIELTPQERREIMSVLPERLSTVVRPPRRETRRSRLAQDREETGS